MEHNKDKALCVNLLDASSKNPQCCCETPIGTLVIGGRCVDDKASGASSVVYPEVSSLSVLGIGRSEAIQTVPLFAKTQQSAATGITSSIQKLLHAVQSTRGLQRRLEAIVEDPSRKRRRPEWQTLSHPLVDFQKLSEKVFSELLTAVEYSWNKEIDTKPQAGRENAAFGVQFVETLYKELEELERLYPQNTCLVRELSEGLDQLSLCYQDVAGRVHPLQLRIAPGANGCVDVWHCHAELPMEVWGDFPNQQGNQSGANSEATKPTTATTNLAVEVCDAMEGHEECKNLAPLEQLFGSTSFVTNSMVESKTEAESSLTTGIISIYKEFCKRIDQIQEFLNEMEDLDRHCNILKPPLVTVTERQLQINDSISITVSVNVWNARKSLKSYKFNQIAGADNGGVDDNAGGAFQSRFERNLQILQWNTNISIRENLEQFLETSLSRERGETTSTGAPNETAQDETKRRTENDDLDDAFCCKICYTKSLPAAEPGVSDEEPSITCDNPSCDRVYHKSCLYDWLESLATSKITFDIIVGECPYCQTPIGCPVGD